LRKQVIPARVSLSTQCKEKGKKNVKQGALAGANGFGDMPANP